MYQQLYKFHLNMILAMELPYRKSIIGSLMKGNLFEYN